MSDNISASALSCKEPRSAGISLIDLNDDVLSDILSYVSPCDALGLSAAARGIHLIAKRRALQSIEIRTSKKLARISAYLLYDIRSRMHWVRELSIFVHICLPSPRYITIDEDGSNTVIGSGDPPHDVMESARCIALLLSEAANLTHLTIHTFDALLALQPRAGKCLASLLNLLDVELYDVGCPQSLEVLSDMRSKPRRLSLGVSPIAIRCAKFLTSITGMQNTCILTLSYLNFWWASSHQFDKNYELHHSWPAVRDLSLTSCRFPMSVAVRLFPSVRVLRVAAHLYSTDDMPSVCWSSLDLVEANVELFEHWEMTCPVRHVSLSSILAIPSMQAYGAVMRSGEPDLATALRLVEATSPIILDFSIMADTKLASSFWADLVMIAPRLRSLEVELCAFHDTEGLNSYLNTWIDRVSPILGQFSALLHIGIWINSSLHRPSCGHDGERTGLDPDHGVAYNFASSLTKHLLSTDSVFVGFGPTSPFRERTFDEYKGQVWWWNVICDKRQRELQPIEPVIGEYMRESRFKSLTLL